MRVRHLTVIPAAVTALVLGASAASAHECFNASRSQQGNEAAGTHSQAWIYLDLAAELQGAGTPAQVDCLLAELGAAGVPMTLSLHVKGATGQDGVIAAHNPNEEHATDGRGIDHFFDAYGAAFGGAFETCGVDMPF